VDDLIKSIIEGKGEFDKEYGKIYQIQPRI